MPPKKPKDAPAKKEPKPEKEHVEPPKKLSKREKKRLRIQARLALKQKLIRDRLLREIELVKKSLKRGKPLWEELCREIKLKEFRDEMEVWGVETGRLMDKKDEQIDTLLKYLAETQEIQSRNLSMYLDQFDYLTECHRTFRDAATAVYEADASDMIEDFLVELTTVTEVHDRINANAENAMHASNVVTKDRLKQNYELYMKRKFGKVCSEVEKRYTMRDETAKRMRLLQDQLLHWMKVLEGDMVDVHKTAKFLHFMERQRNYVVESNKLNDIERNCRKIISDCQKEIISIETDTDRKIYGLKLEKSYFLDVRSVLKNSISRHKQLTHDKIMGVCSESYSVIKKLKEIVKQGELLLSLGVCCRKYKTEKEKVLPWDKEINPDSDDTMKEFMFRMQFDVSKLYMIYVDISEEELAEQMSKLKNFWYRCSNVQLHNMLLTEEKRKLNEENEKYRNIIRSMKKSDDVEYILESLNIKHLL